MLSNDGLWRGISGNSDRTGLDQKWLEVSTPLKNMGQLGWLFQQYIYIYIHWHVCVYVYIYIYDIFIYTYGKLKNKSQPPPRKVLTNTTNYSTLVDSSRASFSSSAPEDPNEALGNLRGHQTRLANKSPACRATMFHLDKCQRLLPSHVWWYRMVISNY